jgi:hypothetical protein
VKNAAELRLPAMYALLLDSIGIADGTIGYGGGLLLFHASLRVRGSATVQMELNKAELIGGGGIAVMHKAVVTVEKSGILIVKKNHGKDGAGSYVQDGSAIVVKTNGTLRYIENHAVVGTSTATPSYGGGISMVRDCVLQIIQNGRIHFEGNKAGIGGGLTVGLSSRLFVGPAWPEPMNIERLPGASPMRQSEHRRSDDGYAFIFENNTASNRSGGGGVAILEGGSLHAHRTGLFQNNEAPRGGGGAISVPRTNDNDGSMSCVGLVLEVGMRSASKRKIDIETVPHTSLSGLGGEAITNKRTYHCLPCGRYELHVQDKKQAVEFTEGEYLAISLLRQKSAVADIGEGLMPQQTLLHLPFRDKTFKFGDIFEIPCSEQGVVLHSIRFVKNKALVGGAISADERLNTMLDVSSSVFLENTAKGSRGGAVFLSGFRNGARFSRGCEFRGNKVLSGSGGALSIENSAAVRVVDCTATDNHALKGDGGFLFLNNAFASMLQRVNISRGTATGGGGAIAAKATRLAFEEVAADDCSANGMGGTLFLDGAAEGHLLQCTFSNGRASSGGLVYVATSKLVLHGRNSSLSWPAEPPLSQSTRGVEDMLSGNLENEASVFTTGLGGQKYALFSSGTGCSDAGGGGWGEVVSQEACIEAGFMLRLSGFDAPGTSATLTSDDVYSNISVNCYLSTKISWNSQPEVRLHWAGNINQKDRQGFNCSKQVKCVCSRAIKDIAPNKLIGGHSRSSDDGGGAIGCGLSYSDTLLSLHQTRATVSCSNNALALIDSSFNAVRRALACFGNGVQINGAEIKNSTAVDGGNGGAICAADCSVSIRYSDLSGNKATADGGAVSITSGSLLNVSMSTRFTGNHAARSGGGLACSGCKNIILSGGTIFRHNEAEGGGGAVFAKGATAELRSTGSQFLKNTAQQDGGAIHIVKSFKWLSDSDILTENTAHNSGGGFAVEGTALLLNGKTMVTGNSGGGGGGGGLFWNSLAPNRSAQNWHTFAPKISDTVIFDDTNTARYGKNMATQPRSLRSVTANYTAENDGAFKTRPNLTAIDYYGQDVRGKGLEGWTIAVEMDEDSVKSNYDVSGNTRANISQDESFFVFDRSLLLSGKRLPDRGPHKLRFKGTFTTEIGDRFTILIPEDLRPYAFIEACDDKSEKKVVGNRVVCSACPSPEKMTSNGVTCVCNGLAPVDGEIGRGYFFNQTKLNTNETDLVSKSCSVCPRGADCSFKNHALIHELSAKPGYWRPRNDAAVFVDCSRAFSAATNATHAAETRCCPLVVDSVDNNRSVSVCSRTFVASRKSSGTTNGTEYPLRQCETGYGGPMCMACIDDSYTMDSQGVCSKCEGGADFGSLCGALAVVFGIFFCVFALCFLKVDGSGRSKTAASHIEVETTEENLAHSRDKSAAGRFVADQVAIGRVGADGQNTTVDTRTDLQVITDRISVFYGSLQVLTSVTLVFDVPWPDQFKILTFRLRSVINFDLASLFSMTACNLALPSVTMFKIHMAIPAILLLTIFLARIPAWVLRYMKTKTRKKKSRQHALMMKIIITVTLIIYPGLCVRLFTTLKCISVPGIDQDVLGRPVERSVMAVAYDVACDDRPLGVAVIACLVWVVGIPCAILIMLVANRAHLFDPLSPKHEDLVEEYGTYSLGFGLCFIQLHWR